MVDNQSTNQASTSPTDTSSVTPDTQSSSQTTVVPDDQSASSEPDRPISTILADQSVQPIEPPVSEQPKDDSTTPGSSQTSPVQEQSVSPSDSSQSPPSPPSPTPTSSIPTVDTNRPDSTNLADSQQIPTSDQSASLESQEENKPPEIPNISESPVEPEATQSANLKQTQPVQEAANLADSTSEEPKPDTSVVDKPIDPSLITQLDQSDQLDQSFQSPPPPPTSSSPTAPSNPSDSTIPSSPSQAIDLNSSDNTNKDIGTGNNQAIQVQPGTPEDTSSSNAEKSTKESASFNSELPQSPTIPLSPPAETPPSGQSVIFGDILSGTTNPAQSTPSASSDLSNINNPSNLPEPSFSGPTSTDNLQPTTHNSPPVSFGDLIKDIDYSVQTVPETDRPVEQTTQSSPTSPLPATASASAGQTTQSFQNSSTTLPSTSPLEPVIIEKPMEVIKEVVKEIPVIDQEEIQKQFEEKSKAKLAENRLKANLARSQKKKNHLDKILELARSKNQITNQDVRNLLHVSQSSATNYLSTLVSQGLLKIQKRAKATFYSI